MPIYKDDLDAKVVHYGYGDILTVKGRSEDSEIMNEVVLLLDNKEPHEVGELRPLETPTRQQDFPDCVRLRFDKIASLDVLIECLISLRNEMTSHLDGDQPD